MPKSSVVLLVIDAVLIAIALLSNFAIVMDFGIKLLLLVLIPLLIFVLTFYFKKLYANTDLTFKNTYKLFEAVAVATAFTSIPLLVGSFNVITACISAWAKIFWRTQFVYLLLFWL